jgi:hypothetical protein
MPVITKPRIDNLQFMDTFIECWEEMKEKGFFIIYKYITIYNIYHDKPELLNNRTLERKKFCECSILARKLFASFLSLSFVPEY